MAITETRIPGLVLVDLPLHGDNRGWFKENWQREKMIAAGLPDFGPVQNNISFNDAVGTTRGIHAEPWDKFVSLATGRIFGAWVDLREGPTFGAVFTAELDPSRAIFVPRGVGNAYQTLEPGTAYTYLVNDHWSAENTDYAFLNLADETAAIDWPIPLDQVEISAKDKNHPRLQNVTPIAPRKILITGADGQVGRALRAEFGDAAHIEYAGREQLDLTDPELGTARRWRDYGAIINAAAYTAVDRAETTEGRLAAWQVNAAASARLAAIATEFALTLVHISSDYVFDGSAAGAYDEDTPFAPLGVYGQSKAAGDLAVATAPRHYIVRTSWLIGDGDNFVRTMASLAERGIDPRVVNDQTGRLTFADDIARGIRHLLGTAAPYGTYNLTGGGEPQTWADVARDVYRLTGHDPARVRLVSTAEYFADATDPIAARPGNSVLDLRKIGATGFVPADSAIRLAEYLR
ncbi:sugar nucleotide-binding protein [Microbacterium sp. 2216-1]|uniref:sugar nucleotide-binding protein n=1 Tax=Microbacterium sp. 2216-1 TaxID=3390053 RepID=UPI003976E61D